MGRDFEHGGMMEMVCKSNKSFCCMKSLKVDIDDVNTVIKFVRN